MEWPAPHTAKTGHICALITRAENMTLRGGRHRDRINVLYSGQHQHGARNAIHTTDVSDPAQKHLAESILSCYCVRQGCEEGYHMIQHNIRRAFLAFERYKHACLNKKHVHRSWNIRDVDIYRTCGMFVCQGRMFKNQPVERMSTYTFINALSLSWFEIDA